MDFQRGHYREPGRWWRVISGDGVSAAVTCPDCGGPVPLTKHKIDAGGGVRPSVGCGACGHYLGNVRLLDWHGGAA